MNVKARNDRRKSQSKQNSKSSAPKVIDTEAPRETKVHPRTLRSHPLALRLDLGKGVWQKATLEDRVGA